MNRFNILNRDKNRHGRAAPNLTIILINMNNSKKNFIKHSKIQII